MNKLCCWSIVFLIVISGPVLSQPPSPSPDNVAQNLRQGKITLQDLWRMSAVNNDFVVQILNERGWQKPANRSISNQLCAWLVKNAPDKVKDPLALSSRTRERLAHYFQSIRDPRTVTYYEAILSLIKTPRKNSVDDVFQLSNYYASIGDLQKAIDTCLRIGDYSESEVAFGIADLSVARFYRQMGNTDKSQEYYKKAEQSTYGWTAGITLLDEAYRAMAKGKYAEARTILSKPISGKYAGQARVLLLLAMAQSYDREGNSEQARKYAQQCVAQYNSLNYHLPHYGIEDQVDGAKSMLERIDRWEKLPIPVLVKPKEFTRVFPAGDQPILQQITVDSELPITITAVSDNKKVQILYTSQKAVNAGGYFFNVAQLKIVREDVKATITIHSPQYPKWVEHVKINVTVRKEDSKRTPTSKSDTNK